MQNICFDSYISAEVYQYMAIDFWTVISAVTSLTNSISSIASIIRITKAIERVRNVILKHSTSSLCFELVLEAYEVGC